jgi:soluble lytic murein transglycosylase
MGGRNVMRALRPLVFVLAACGGKNTPDAATPAADASTDGLVLEAGADDAASASAPATWVQLVREERWAAAGAAIDALPDGERNKPAVRFARATVAFTRGDGKTAVSSLESLEGALPALAPEIARLRARAQVNAGPFVDAGEWLEKHAASNDDHLAAANAFMKAKLPTRATSQCARVVSSDHHSHAQEVEARAIRMHTGEAADVIGDARWLVVHGDTTHTRDAEAVLAKEDPKHPLVQKEWLARAQALADAAQTDEAVHALERAQTAPQPSLSGTAMRRARADLFMRARVRYGEAATLFKQCSNDAGNAQAASDLVWSGRALSRADHDDEAIERYDEVAARYGKSGDAAAAAFFAARLELLHGRWEKAAQRFDEYMTRYPNGGDWDEAMHLRALAHFEKPGSDIKKVRAMLEQRAGTEHDANARARMENLAALAASKDGDRTHAVARFTDVAKTLPLTWPALVARARLVQLGAPVPPAIPAGADQTSTPLTVALPEAVAILDRIGLSGAAEEALRAREGDVTAGAPSRSVEALCIAYGKIDRGKRRMQLSTQISAANLQNAPNPSTRWAWECAYPTPFSASARDAEVKETLPTGLVHAVMRQESSFDETAISPARAVGALQLLPETAANVARQMGIRLEEGDLKSGPRSITLGAHYLHDLVVKAHGSLPLAVASYNAGEDAVLRWAERMKGMDIDAFVESIPFFETRGYVVKVMESFARYGFLERGEEGVPKIELR